MWLEITLFVVVQYQHGDSHEQKNEPTTLSCFSYITEYPGAGKMPPELGDLAKLAGLEVGNNFIVGKFCLARLPVCTSCPVESSVGPSVVDVYDMTSTRPCASDREVAYESRYKDQGPA